MHRKVVVLGASLGGLSAGITLLESGIEVLLLEASLSPSVKTCGEFISHEAIALLNSWDITPNREITKVYFHHEERELSRILPAPCASMPRLTLETALLERLLKLGGELKLGTRVHHIIPGPPFQLHIDQGEVLQTENLLVATGRFQGASSPSSLPYRGIKNHYLMQQPPSALHMTFFPHGYYGFSPLDHKTAVLSCLIKQKALDSFGGDLTTFMQQHLPKNALLERYLKGALPFFQEPLTTSVGTFGCKTLPPWPHSYFVGDATATVAPLIGQGITMALTSGKMAAAYISEKKGWQEYRKAWKKRYQRRVEWSRFLHSIATYPPLFTTLFPLLEKYPKALEMLFKQTR